MGQAVAQSGVAPVEIEGGVEAGGGAAMREQLGFEGAPAGRGLGVIVGVARSAKAGQRLGLFEALLARRAGVLTAAGGVDNEARRWLA